MIFNTFNFIYKDFWTFINIIICIFYISIHAAFQGILGVATHLENLEKSGNYKVVRENEKKPGKSQ